MGPWSGGRAGRTVGVTALAAALLAGCTSGQRAERDHEARGRIGAETPVAAAMESLPPVATPRLSRQQERGRELYDSLCWTCHGLYGHGDGPQARRFAGALRDIGNLALASPVDAIVARMQRPPDDTGPDAAAAAWHALPPDTLRLAVAYLTTLNDGGSHGNPSVGRLLYAAYCVQCHGVRGAGDGRLSATFAPRPKDLRSLRLAGQESHVLTSIREGGPRDHRAYMPDWGRVMSDAQLRDVMSYLAVLRAAR